MSSLDKRIHAYRDDLADMTLKGKVKAEKYIAGKTVQFTRPVTSVHKTPSRDTTQLTQAVLGETAKVFDNKDGWAWVQLDGDGYVGYVQSASLSATVFPTTHRLIVPSSFALSKPDIKSQPAIPVVMNSRFTVTKTENGFAALERGGFVFAEHMKPISEEDKDFASHAEAFLHTPYHWGGKTTLGIDCSGLVQTALNASGIACPRDSDMQEASLGKALGADDFAKLKRGDLVFWKGHVGIMLNESKLLHASGHQMLVVIEPLVEVIGRNDAKGNPVNSIRRL